MTSKAAGKKRKMEDEDNEEIIQGLDCTVCYSPLRLPLFQCENGHVACPSCCDKLQNKCPPTCSLSIKHDEDELIESIRVPCSNKGCKDKIPYTDLRKHQEDTCIHAHFFCPIPDCSFSGSIDLLWAHFNNCHKDVVVQRVQSVGAHVWILRKDPFRVIRVNDYKELFLLVNRNVSAGHALSMTCIGPQSSEYSLEYELSIDGPGKKSSLLLKAPIKSSRKWDGSIYSTDLFLLATPKFQEVGSPIVMQLTLRKENA